MRTSGRSQGAISAALSNKNAVRLASTGNVDITSAPATMDTVALHPGDRVLLKDQTAGAENGPRLFVGAGQPMPRTPDANSSDSIVPGMEIVVSEGATHADTIWLLSTDAPIVLGVTPLGFVAPRETGGSAADYSVRTVTAADSLQASDRIVYLDASAAPFTFTLSDPAARPGRPVSLVRVNTGTNRPTVTAAVGTIMGAASQDLLIARESFDLVSSGADWGEV